MGHDIAPLIQLKHLDLSGNALESLDGITLLTTVKTLWLTKCRLEHIDGIEALTDLDTVDLFNNKLASLAGLTSLSRLVTLDVSFNKLADLDGLGGLGAFKTLMVEYNKIEVVNGCTLPSRLCVLELHGNALHTMTGMDHLEDLHTLHVAENPHLALDHVSFPPFLKRLFAGNTRVAHVVHLRFASSSTLLVLDLTNAVKPERPLARLVLSGLPFSIQRLHLGQNKIESIVGFAHFRDLRKLTLEYNALPSLSDIEHLTRLSALDASYNPIEKLKKTTFPPSLRELSNIRTQKPALLVSLKRRTLLYTQSNMSLRGVRFPPRLRRLNLRDNGITSLQRAVFPATLRQLDLAINPIKDMHLATFPAALFHLILDGNRKFTSMRRVRFPPLLRVLSMQNTGLTVLDGRTLPTFLVLLQAEASDIHTIIPSQASCAPRHSQLGEQSAHFVARSAPPSEVDAIQCRRQSHHVA